MVRNTQQRDAIRRAFEDADRPLSPEEVLASARRHAPRIGIATIYRNVRALVEEGWLHTVELPGTPSRYEISGKHHHHHFHCRGCDRVYEVDDCPGSLKDLLPNGYQLESHEIILYGLCRTCVAEA